MDEVKVEAELRAARRRAPDPDAPAPAPGPASADRSGQAGHPAGPHPQGAARGGPQTAPLQGGRPELSTRRASEQVADDIRAFMRREGLQPGDRLGREEDLARTFGVSRPTLREALRLLSSAHLMRASKGPGGGIFVAATTEEGIALTVSESVASMLAADAIELDELLETRMLVEIPLAGLAAARHGAGRRADPHAARGVRGGGRRRRPPARARARRRASPRDHARREELG
jgi:DNA-binding GntR family transcriptional regulator